MITARPFILAALALVASAAMPAPAGPSAKSCGSPHARDAVIQLLDRSQSSGATQICAFYLNRMAALAAH